MRSALVLAIGLAACGNDDHGGGAFAPINQLDSTYQQAYCTHLVACGEFPDLPTCLSASIGAFPLMLSPTVANSEVVAAVLAGTVIYNGTKMDQCITALAAQSCDTTDQDGRVLPLECLETLRGTIAAGGACQLNVECVSQLCNAAPCDQNGGCCPGKCVGDTAPVPQPIAIGKPCGLDATDTCVVGAFCDGSSGMCLPLESAGSSCFESSQCGFGLACAGTQSLECTPLPTLGEPCPAFMCRDEGTYCSSTTQTCTADGLPSVMCTSSTDCSPYFQCDMTTHECAPNPRVGESCLTARCFDVGTYCDSESNLCELLIADGQPCNTSDACKSGDCNLAVGGGTCTEPPTCL